ncbi:MAG: pyrroline-5-carboxylate reductase [Fusobacterium sp.]|nr:pyrroline-5-carboxylate reductase [Fusobacterium sp.]
MKIGFIGTGNMGTAIIRGLIESKFVPNENIVIFDLDKTKMNLLKNEYSINLADNEIELVKQIDIIILAVKPHIYPVVLEKIKDFIEVNTLILTIAAGFKIESVEKIIGADKKIIRTMPNVTAQVLEGMTAVSFNKNIENSDKEIIFKLLSSFGKFVEMDENLIHAHTGISGSLPAYAYIFMEALADAGVLEGMPRDKVYEIVAQSVLGSAKMLLETKKHPAQLKDEVTSPAGTTIEAIKILENGNFRGTVINAVHACVEKSKKLAGE